MTGITGTITYCTWPGCVGHNESLNVIGSGLTGGEFTGDPGNDVSGDRGVNANVEGCLMPLEICTAVRFDELSCCPRERLIALVALSAGQAGRPHSELLHEETCMRKRPEYKRNTKHEWRAATT